MCRYYLNHKLIIILIVAEPCNLFRKTDMGAGFSYCHKFRIIIFNFFNTSSIKFLDIVKLFILGNAVSYNDKINK